MYPIGTVEQGTISIYKNTKTFDVKYKENTFYCSVYQTRLGLSYLSTDIKKINQFLKDRYDDLVESAERNHNKKYKGIAKAPKFENRYVLTPCEFPDDTNKTGIQGTITTDGIKMFWTCFEWVVIGK